MKWKIIFIQMETHASDEISKERQRRSQHQHQGGDGDVDGLEGGMAAVRLGGHEDNGGGEEDAEANEANGGGARSENAAEEDEDVDDDDQDCDYVPENYHDENSKKNHSNCIIRIHLRLRVSPIP